MTRPDPQKAPRLRSFFGKAAAMLLLAGSVCLLAAALNGNAVHRDSICYWSSARLLWTHGDPYDAAAILRLETGAGGAFHEALIMRNPPWALWIVAPLGRLNAPAAGLLWELTLIGAALGAMRALRQGANDIPLIAYLFAPVLACVMAGQTSLLVVLAFCLFMRLEKRPFLAGLALSMTLLKPHLVLLVWAVVGLEALAKRRFRVLAGGFCGIAAASAWATLVDPRVWMQYHAAIRAEDIQQQFLPNIACVVRALVTRTAVWPQLIPLAVGLAGTMWFWSREREGWQWRRQGAMVLALSMLVAPYSWLVDGALFLPAVTMCWPLATWSEKFIFWTLNLMTIAVMLRFPELSSAVYVWAPPVWMFWCWAVYRRKIPESVADETAAAAATA